MDLKTLQKEAYQNAVDHGFFNNMVTITDMLCWMHSEVDEAIEALDLKHRCEELADVAILCLTLSEWKKFNIESVFKVSYLQPDNYGDEYIFNFLHGSISNAWKANMIMDRVSFERMIVLIFSFVGECIECNGADPETEIKKKMAFNKTRPHLHGRGEEP